QDVVRAVRNLRSERKIDAGRWLEAYVVADSGLAKHAPAIEQLARVRPLHIVFDRSEAPSDSVATAVLDGATVVLPMAGLFDSTAERANLEKQRDQAKKLVDDLERKLSSDFASKAPPHIVTGERERLEAAKTRLAGIEARLKELE